MKEITTIGLDIAKTVFQVHGISAGGEVVVGRRLRRSEILTFFSKLQPCLIGMEACPTAHHWARVLTELGHNARLMPPAYVKPYVKRQKNDMTDAEAICEAVRRPTMRFVPVKSVEQQSILSLHRTRDLLIRQRTSLINALRAHLAEYGIAAAQGAAGRSFLAALVEDEDLDLIPPLVRTALLPLVDHIRALEQSACELEAAIKAWHRSNATSQRLATVPGIGPITASALAATIADPSLFRSGRHMAAWLGLVPRQSSSGGKQRLGRISKQGDPYLRRLLVVGATAVLRFAKTDGSASSALLTWAARLKARKPYKVVALSLANKLARIAWAIMVSGETFSAQPAR
jgi:transposase